MKICKYDTFSRNKPAWVFVLAIGKDQALVQGVFYPTSDKNVIYRCQIDDTIGFLKDFVIFSGITGIFTFSVD